MHFFLFHAKARMQMQELTKPNHLVILKLSVYIVFRGMSIHLTGLWGLLSVVWSRLKQFSLTELLVCVWRPWLNGLIRASIVF